MIKRTRMFIPIPKIRDTHVKIEIDGNDLTNRVKESSFDYPVTRGIGTFSMVLSNAGGQITGLSSGSVVKFYADNKDGTTEQFRGRIDHIKDNITKKGQVLEIKGRHVAYLLTEFTICYTTTGEKTSQILKDIIDKLPDSYEFTKNNISTTTDSMDVKWDYKPFWDCVLEISKFAEHDCYVDHDLDFHYFPENSIENDKDAIVEGDNLIDSKGWGINDYYEKTRVTVIGQGEEGLPIIYTAVIDNEIEIREKFIRDSSANTETKVKNLAESKLLEITNYTPQAIIKSFGLETIKPGDNIWILIPRQKVFGQYKIVKIIQKFGSNIGGWRTDLLMEKEAEEIYQVIESIDKKSDRLINVENVNKFEYSWNFEFNNDTGIHLTTKITEGVLKTDGSSGGTWISDLKALSEDISMIEFRVKGEKILGTDFFISADNGAIYNKITSKTSKTISGRNLRIKVKLNSESTQIYSMVLLFS